MVVITDYSEHHDSDGNVFFMLRLEGGLTMVKSKQTDRYYMTVKSCKVPCTFEEEMIQGIIGTKMPGSVVRVECDPYEYTVEETGEVLMLSHRWQYSPDEDASVVVSNASLTNLLSSSSPSTNGVGGLV